MLEYPGPGLLVVPVTCSGDIPVTCLNTREKWNELSSNNWANDSTEMSSASRSRT